MNEQVVHPLKQFNNKIQKHQPAVEYHGNWVIVQQGVRVETDVSS
ncbi:hypothetical protein [Fischerella sp. PCC 9605]|nr:hypothetical protein [Fischerella sp. PCC 9605]